MLARLTILTAIFLISTCSGCFLQPINQVNREFYVMSYDAPAFRLGKAVRGELWAYKDGKWVPVGEGDIPAGTLMKFVHPAKDIREILKEENNGPSN